MTLAHVVWRSLRHYRAMALSTAAGVAVAACVISGSILAGDSVSATVRRTTLSRLGSADAAVVSSRPFGLHIAQALANDRAVRSSVPLLLRAGSAANPDTEVTVARVQLIGADRSFVRLFPGSDQVPHFEGRSALVSRTLADELSLAPGDTLLVRVASAAAEPVQSLFARRKLRDAVKPLRLECAGVVPAEGPGGFALYAETAQPRNVIVDRAWLAEQLGAEDSCDVTLLDVRPDADLDALEANLPGLVTLSDLGLAAEASERPVPQVVVRGSGVTLGPEQLHAVEDLLLDGFARAEPASIMLASKVACARSGSSAHYALLAAVPDVAVPEGGIVLNRWLADRLKASSGDTVTIEWLEPASDGSYPTRSASLRVASVISVEAAQDQTWAVPEFKGITDTERISDWDPPFPLDLSLITSDDEDYWERWRTAPKAFVSLAMARRMWGSAAEEWATAARYRVRSAQALGDARSAVERGLRENPQLQGTGPVLRRIRAEALGAARGSSDFRALLLGMSIFIVLSGIALAGMMLRLSAERRASQLGIMLATGFTPQRAALALAAEGAAAAMVGAVAGALLGLPFAGALISALNSWWAGAVAQHPIAIEPGLAGPVLGAAAAFVMGTLAAWQTSRRLASSDALRLLAGWRSAALTDGAGRSQGAGSSAPAAPPARRFGSAVSWLLALAGLGLLLWRGGDWIPEAASALLGGAVLLAAGLRHLSDRLSALLHAPAHLSLARIAWRNAALRRGQSVLIAGVIGASAFLLVVVASHVRSSASFDVLDKSSGAGGFNLIARTGVPLPVNFDTPAGRANLGFDPEDEALFADVEIVSCLISPGADASCLNLAKPMAPRILGVPDALIRRGGFSVLTGQRVAEPWSLLTVYPVRADAEARTVPAFGDAESVRWILQSGLGKSIARDTPAGRFVLRFDGLLPFSIFAGEILVSERNFRRMFPGVQAPSYYLIRTRPGSERALADALRRNLGSVGMEVRPARELLAEVLAVQNTYLSAFLLLGGLGIALGSLGIGVIQLRSAYERRSELALMTALGFARRDLAAMILTESAGLLVYGAALGTVTALAASAARVAVGEAAINWAALGAVLGAVVMAGIGSCVAAAYRATAGSVIEAIRSE